MYYPDARVRRFFWRATAVEMGAGTLANQGIVVSDDYTSGEVLLRIGDYVSIAPHVVFAPVSEPNNSELMRQHAYVSANLAERKQIVVKDDVSIGAQVAVLPGVKITRRAMVGASVMGFFRETYGWNAAR